MYGKDAIRRGCIIEFYSIDDAGSGNGDKLGGTESQVHDIQLLRQANSDDEKAATRAERGEGVIVAPSRRLWRWLIRDRRFDDLHGINIDLIDLCIDGCHVGRMAIWRKDDARRKDARQEAI